VDRSTGEVRRYGARSANLLGRKMGDAKEALRDAVEREVVRGVRRAVLRQRKRFGL
jgi:hypothetical protein